MDVGKLVVAFILSFITAFFGTLIIKKLAIRYNVLDHPDNIRKTHIKTTPSMGGLAIFIGAAAGLLYLNPVNEYIGAIILGAFIILMTGLLDDIYNLTPFQKLAGQLTAAIIVISSGLIIESLTIPFLGTVSLGYFGYVITVLWIVGASNAINLIDGLDGLASGVSTIALASIFVMAVMDQQMLVITLCVILIGANLGFLPHNFHPAKIFMGDTGALFLGYAIAIVSMLGLFKNVAFFSFIVPIIVIAIPIFDTIQAIIRRVVKKQDISTADHKHIHYKLMERGYSHRSSVLIIYGFSVFFGLMAIIFNSSTLLSSLAIFGIIVMGIELIAEISGMTFRNRQPIINWLRKWLPIGRTRIRKNNPNPMNNPFQTPFNKTTKMK